MPKYLAKESLKDAVERLAVCSADASLGDYLIFKRAAALNAKRKDKSPNAVVTGLKSETFVAAVEAFSLIGDPKDKALSPYYVPFGAKRDKTAGYRTYKFPSNGSSDTASRWQSRPGKPLEFVPNSSPKTFTIEKRSSKQLAEFFLTQNGAKGRFSGEKPRLTDTAIWWFRNAKFDKEVAIEDLVAALIKDFQLSDDERDGLFQPSQTPETEKKTAQ